PVFRDIPKDRHTSLMASPSSSRATNRTRSSIAEHSFQGIDTPRQRERCYLCVRYDSSPMSRVAHRQIHRLIPTPLCSHRSVLQEPPTTSASVAPASSSVTTALLRRP